MRLKQIILVSNMLLCLGIINSQTATSQNYYVTKNDTVFCKELKYGTTIQGYLNEIDYVNLQGKRIHLKGRKNVPDVLTFFIEGKTFDKTPLKAHKPNGYIRYTDRVVDGKLKVYISRQGYNHSHNSALSGPTGIYRFYLKMPDGTYYKINKRKNMKKYIKPYLLECEKFKNEYKGDFSSKEFEFLRMIDIYNSLCE